MELVEHLGVSYVPSAPPNASHTFDVYVPNYLLCAHNSHPGASALVCFVHGGAWRSEDKADHVALAHKLAIATGYPVALPNYRLTPSAPTPRNYLHHPAHAADALQFLEFILSWHTENGGHLPRKPNRLFLIGHSCSAHMLCTVFLRMPSTSESIRPSEELVRSVTAIILSEGIYDIDLLLSSFPGYRSWFIENTFGQRRSFEDVSAIRATMRPDTEHIRWFIVHSKGDTLVDERQSDRMYDFLRVKSRLVSRSFGDLEDEHNSVLNSPRYIAIVDGYIKSVVRTDVI